MIIIGHRGAAGIEPENTLPSIESAAQHEVDVIEFDLQKTKDNHLIVFHDDNLLRLAGQNIKISDMTLKQINLTATRSGHPIPSFHEAMEAAKNIPVLLDCKGKDWAEILEKQLKKYPTRVISITAQDRNELARISKLRPDIETYVSELTKPFDAIYSAKALGLTGISLNFWVLNPLSYWVAKRKNCKILVFTINYPWMARFIHKLYPEVAIITNVPNKLIDKFKRPHDKSKAST
jgi:glycerophosphoryl diester phosphodiesterase